MNVHAGLAALRIGGLWRGALIQGTSGVGKSDLLLRLVEHGFRLVADDRTILWRSGERLYGRAPDVLRNRLEARGLGVLEVPSILLAQVALVVGCAAADAELERVPEARTTSLAGAEIPLFALRPLEPSAPAKLRRALLRLGTATAAP